MCQGQLSETFGDDAIALGLFDASPCAAAFRADMLAVAERVAKEAGPQVLDAVAEFARCSLGLPRQGEAAAFSALCKKHSANGSEVEVAAYVAAYAAWKPPARCLGMIVSCILTGGSWKECLTSVVGCVLADLRSQFGGKIGDLIGNVIGGTSGGSSPPAAKPPTVLRPDVPTDPGAGGPVTGGPGLVKGGRS